MATSPVMISRKNMPLYEDMLKICVNILSIKLI